MEKAIVVRPMVEKEARDCVDRINTNMKDVRYLILDLYEREGWSALGYDNWRECVAKEFNQGENYLYKQLAAAQMEKNICTIVQKTPIPEGQLRPLSKLEPDQQREAWQQAVSTAPDGKVTAAHVTKIVKEMTTKETIIEITPRNNNNQELISDDFKRTWDSFFDELKNAKALKWSTTSRESAIKHIQVLLDVATIR